MIQPIDEKELVANLMARETRSKAFEKVVRMYSEQLYWHIRRMVLAHEDANDLLQNTFVKAWTNMDSFRGESKLSSWLYRIAINETLTFLNKRHETTSLDLEMNEGTSIADKLEADPYFDGDETQRLLQEAILTLPDKQRLVFNMKYFQEMKYEEISQLLGTSVGALKASYHLAVKKISLFLEGYN